MLDDKTLAALDEAEKKATPGLWRYDSGNCDVEGPLRENVCDVSNSYRLGEPDPRFHSSANLHDDGNFIALARNHMRALIDEVKAARGHMSDCAGLDCCEAGDMSYAARTAEEQNEKLRAELAAARDALNSIVVSLEAGAYLTPKELCSHSKLALKRIEESGPLK